MSAFHSGPWGAVRRWWRARTARCANSWQRASAKTRRPSPVTTRAETWITPVTSRHRARERRSRGLTSTRVWEASSGRPQTAAHRARRAEARIIAVVMSQPIMLDSATAVSRGGATAAVRAVVLAGRYRRKCLPALSASPILGSQAGGSATVCPHHERRARPVPRTDRRALAIGRGHDNGNVGSSPGFADPSSVTRPLSSEPKSAGCHGTSSSDASAVIPLICERPIAFSRSGQ